MNTFGILAGLVSLTLAISLPAKALAITPSSNQPYKLLKDVPTLLDEATIQQRMAELPSTWTTDGTTLFYEATFKDFVTAMAFVNAMVEPAEALDHHPDITIRYNQVTLAITTHDAGGLTELDFQLAARIAALQGQTPDSITSCLTKSSAILQNRVYRGETSAIMPTL